AAFANGPQSCGNERPDRRKDNGAIERFGRDILRASCPRGPELPGKSLHRVVAFPGESKHLAALPARDLCDDMTGGAQAVKSELVAVARDLQRPPANQSRAQQWRRRDIITVFGQREHVARIGNNVGGIASVARITSEQRAITEIFPAIAAVSALSAGSA